MIKEDLQEKINSYISGELSEDESIEVKKLIESSEEIRAYYEQVSNMWRSLDNLEDIEPSLDYVSQFWNKVEREESKKKYSFLNIFNLNKKWVLHYFSLLFLIFTLLILLWILSACIFFLRYKKI